VVVSSVSSIRLAGVVGGVLRADLVRVVDSVVVGGVGATCRGRDRLRIVVSGLVRGLVSGVCGVLGVVTVRVVLPGLRRLGLRRLGLRLHGLRLHGGLLGGLLDAVRRSLLRGLSGDLGSLLAGLGGLLRCVVGVSVDALHDRRRVLDGGV